MIKSKFMELKSFIQKCGNEMKTNITFLLLFFLAVSSSAQNRAVLKASGDIISTHETQPSLNLKQEKKDKQRSHVLTNSIPLRNVNGMSDTLKYFAINEANTNFGIFGQDWVLQWFIAPVDMYIPSIGISIAEIADTNVLLEVKLVKLNWKKADLQSIGEQHFGYYPAAGNGNNNITAFLDNPDRTGDWVDASGLGLTSPFAKDIWSDSGKGVIIKPILKTAERQYQWIKLETLGDSPVVQAGTIVGLAVRNLSSTNDSVRVGISSGTYSGGYTGFKFYSNGRNQSGIDLGWWSRAFTFDFALEVELGEGCWPFINFTKLVTTLSTEPREVSVDIQHCEFDDIEKSIVEFVYSLDGGVTYSKLQLTTTDSAGVFQTYRGTLPSFPTATEVRYYFQYTNAVGNQYITTTISYSIFKPENPTLLVFNGPTLTTGYPQSYYFGSNGATTTGWEIISFPRDKWAYGKLTKELVDYYTNIFEITTKGPKDINNDVIKEWLATRSNHNYLLAGDDYLGSITNWTDTTYKAGDFQYDVLGITADHNDISYAVSGDQNKPSLAYGVAGTELGDSLYRKVIELNEDSLKIDPIYEISSSYQNWVDGFAPVAGAVVDVTAKGINGNIYNVGMHRTLPAGNKIVFLAFDPLSLDSPPSSYFWYGFDRVSPLVQALRWFGADVVDVENEVSSPLNFKLSQNYPNPFNPSTVISFQLSVGSKVSLKVYDILGNEVATLVNEEKEAGNYKVNFNAQQTTNNKQLASGIYFYTLRAGNFVQNRKMILLK